MIRNNQNQINILFVFHLSWNVPTFQTNRSVINTTLTIWTKTRTGRNIMNIAAHVYLAV